MSAPVSVPIRKASKSSCGRAKVPAAVCSRCHLPAPGYDRLAERRFEFIPLWGFFVFLLYIMRRVDCRRCGMVAVEAVYAFPSPLSAPPFVERNGGGLSNFVGQGVRCGKTCRGRGFSYGLSFPCVAATCTPSAGAINVASPMRNWTGEWAQSERSRRNGPLETDRAAASSRRSQMAAIFIRFGVSA
jgi:hypothetical protein